MCASKQRMKNCHSFVIFPWVSGNVAFGAAEEWSQCSRWCHRTYLFRAVTVHRRRGLCAGMRWNNLLATPLVPNVSYPNVEGGTYGSSWRRCCVCCDNWCHTCIRQCNNFPVFVTTKEINEITTLRWTRSPVMSSGAKYVWGHVVEVLEVCEKHQHHSQQTCDNIERQERNIWQTCRTTVHIQKGMPKLIDIIRDWLWQCLQPIHIDDRRLAQIMSRISTTCIWPRYCKVKSSSVSFSQVLLRGSLYEHELQSKRRQLLNLSYSLNTS
jgi:hypothetical protein